MLTLLKKLDTQPKLANSENLRLTYIDVSRAIVIILVVLFHYDVAFPDQANKSLYFLEWFRMPTFFLISGILYKAPAKMTTNSFLVKKAKVLILPYFAYAAVFATIGTIEYFIQESIAASGASFSIIVASAKLYIYLIGLTIYGGKVLSLPTAVGWFIVALFLTTSIFTFLKKNIRSSVVLTLVTLGISTIGIWLSSLKVSFPWDLDIAFVAIFYFSLGYHLKWFFHKLNGNLRLSLITTFCFVLPCLAFIFLNTYYSLNFRITMNAGIFSSYILTFLVPPVFSILALSCISTLTVLISKLSKTFINFFIEAGKKTLPILFLHWPILYYLNKTLGTQDIHLTRGWWVLIGLAMPLFISFFLEKSPLLRTLFLARKAEANEGATSKSSKGKALDISSDRLTDDVTSESSNLILSLVKDKDSQPEEKKLYREIY